MQRSPPSHKPYRFTTTLILFPVRIRKRFCARQFSLRSIVQRLRGQATVITACVARRRRARPAPRCTGGVSSKTSFDRMTNGGRRKSGAGSGRQQLFGSMRSGMIVPFFPGYGLGVPALLFEILLVRMRGERTAIRSSGFSRRKRRSCLRRLCCCWYRRLA